MEKTNHKEKIERSDIIALEERLRLHEKRLSELERKRDTISNSFARRKYIRGHLIDPENYTRCKVKILTNLNRSE
jgi:hypothetical protein